MLENHGVLTDADLIGMREPPGLGLSSQARSSEGVSTEVMSRGITSPMDIRGILNAIPDFTGVPNPVPQKLPDIHSLFDGIASGRARGERQRDELDGQRPDTRIETPTSRQRAQSEVRRSPETVGGTPNKRIRSSSAVSSVSPGMEAGLRQVSALLGSPEGGAEIQPRIRGAGMAVEDVQMVENSSGGRSPMDRDIPTFYPGASGSRPLHHGGRELIENDRATEGRSEWDNARNRRPQGAR